MTTGAPDHGGPGISANRLRPLAPTAAGPPGPTLSAALEARAAAAQGLPLSPATPPDTQSPAPAGYPVTHASFATSQGPATPLTLPVTTPTWQAAGPAIDIPAPETLLARILGTFSAEEAIQKALDQAEPGTVPEGATGTVPEGATGTVPEGATRGTSERPGTVPTPEERPGTVPQGATRGTSEPPGTVPTPTAPGTVPTPTAPETLPDDPSTRTVVFPVPLPPPRPRPQLAAPPKPQAPASPDSPAHPEAIVLTPGDWASFDDTTVVPTRPDEWAPGFYRPAPVYYPTTEWLGPDSAAEPPPRPHVGAHIHVDMFAEAAPHATPSPLFGTEPADLEGYEQAFTHLLEAAQPGAVPEPPGTVPQGATRGTSEQPGTVPTPEERSGTVPTAEPEPEPTPTPEPSPLDAPFVIDPDLYSLTPLAELVEQARRSLEAAEAARQLAAASPVSPEPVAETPIPSPSSPADPVLLSAPAGAEIPILNHVPDDFVPMADDGPADLPVFSVPAATPTDPPPGQPVKWTDWKPIFATSPATLPPPSPQPIQPPDRLFEAKYRVAPPEPAPAAAADTVQPPAATPDSPATPRDETDVTPAPDHTFPAALNLARAVGVPADHAAPLQADSPATPAVADDTASVSAWDPDDGAAVQRGWDDQVSDDWSYDVPEAEPPAAPLGDQVLGFTQDDTASAPPTLVFPASIGRIPVVKVEPVIEGGAFAAKAVVGEAFPVRARVFREGHDKVNASAILTDPDGAEHRTDLVQIWPEGLDIWEATVTADRQGAWTFRVEAWSDPWATWVHTAEVKLPEQMDLPLVYAEGHALLERTRQEVLDAGQRNVADKLAGWSQLLTVNPTPELALNLLQDPELTEVMATWRPRDFVSPSPDYPLQVDRKLALFSAWYEFFPRSQGAYRRDDGSWQSGTFDTCHERLEAIAAMGFDVAYVPPVHPVGTTFRKGRNNSLEAGPGDPGSPWAIGSPEGGHDAIHPDLGGFEAFDRFVAKAKSLGLEVALDFALQCSPDHPWVTEHPEWFTTRADGTIAYAENPPKKYQDIYPLNFDNDPEGLYREVYRLLEFWIDRGVTIFRVDNPHTKPIQFWAWLMAEMRAHHPDVLFLAEAFTKPEMMHTLGKVGFHQSYTYYAWRNEKWEIEEYLGELSQQMAHFYRPNFFTNTPDINPLFTRSGAPAAFAIRCILAATLSPSWGVYSGFELFEHEPLKEGGEEYLNSEKYEYRPRDFEAEPNLNLLLTTLNVIRKAHPALQQLRHIHFHPTTNDQVIAFSKRAGNDLVLVVCSLDPMGQQQAQVELDLAALGLEGQDRLTAHDALTGSTWNWGPKPYVVLTPQQPAHIALLAADQPA